MQQIALGHQYIHGQTRGKSGVQLHEPRADRCGECIARFHALAKQVSHTDRQKHAVERTARA